MSIDEVNITHTEKMLKYCPKCGSKDVVIFGELLKCHKCHQMYGAFLLNEDIDNI